MPESKNKMDVHDVMPEVFGPRPTGHLRGPSQKEALCGHVWDMKNPPQLVKDRESVDVCYACSEIWRVVEQTKKLMKPAVIKHDGENS